MTNQLKRTIVALLAVWAVGCAQSFHPFYTESSKTSIAELPGSWDAIKALNEMKVPNLHPWVCRERSLGTYMVTAFDTNNAPAELELVCFRTAGQLFCDVTASNGDPMKMPNIYWTTSVRPMHTLWKMSVTNNTVALQALQPDWLRRAVDQKEVNLSFLDTTMKHDRIYTATADDWQRFLVQQATNIAAFSAEPEYVFHKREPATPTPK